LDLGLTPGAAAGLRPTQAGIPCRAQNAAMADPDEARSEERLKKVANQKPPISK